MGLDDREQDFIERLVTLEQGHKQLGEDSVEMKSTLRELSSAVRQLTGFLTGSIDNMGQSVIFEIKTLGTDMKRAILRLDHHEEKLSDHGSRIQVAETHLEDLSKKVAVLEDRQQRDLSRLAKNALVPKKEDDSSKWGALQAFFNGLPTLLEIVKKILPHLGWLIGIGAALEMFATHVK